jgi:hypothetical protein
MDALPPGSSSGRHAFMSAAAQVLMRKTRRGSNRSAMPSTADVSAPATNPICTPLDSNAWRAGGMVVSASTPGMMADDRNHSDRTSTSASTSNAMERRLPGMDWDCHAVAPCLSSL